MNYIMLNLTFRQIDKNDLNELVKWKYEKPFDLYNIEYSPMIVDEFLNGEYYSILDENNKLIAFSCFGKSAQVSTEESNKYYNKYPKYIDIGLGLNPNLCSKGIGESLVNLIIDFGRKELGYEYFRLTVASFNERAMKVYERVGFVKDKQFIFERKEIKREFIIMILK